MTPSPIDEHWQPEGPAATLAVLGAGTWGLTLADLLARNGHRVTCWDINSDLVAQLDDERVHPRLPEFSIHPELRLSADLGDTVQGAEGVIIVVPSIAMRSIGEQLAALGDTLVADQLVICTKGIEDTTLMLMNEVLVDALGSAWQERTGVLSGPSHAEEVCRGLPTTVVACAADTRRAENIQRWFHRPYFRVYTHDDMLGVELGAAVKNVIAIAAGTADGLGFGDNAKAALMTRGLAEIVRLGLGMGARPETFMGLSGIGDLIVTAGSVHSRNYKFGHLIAEGHDVQSALEAVGMVVEGYHTARSAHALANRREVEMPITQAVHAMLYEGVTANDAVLGLLARDPKPEHY